MVEPLVDDQEADLPEVSRRRRWAKRLGWALALLVVPIVLAFLALNSPIGKRWIADQIASYAPASGLTVRVGRIEGDIYRDAILHDVILADPKGPFLTIPVVELDWRPLSWITRGLDIRKVVARRGRLERLPELLPGDPDAPVLPDFDIRIDRFEIDNLTLAPGVATDQAERVDALASADIRDGLVTLKLDGKLGKEDKIALALHAEPDGDRFDLDLDYRAPQGGVVAGLTGAEEGYSARILGDGTWRNWIGHALVKRGDARFAAFRLTNRAGRYGMVGEAYAAEASAGLVQRLLGDRTGLILDGTFESSRFDGTASAFSDALTLRGEGAIDLADNAFEGFAVEVALLDPDVFGEGIALRSASMRATLDGPFREISIAHDITAGEFALGDMKAIGLRQEGTGSFGDGALQVPLALRAGRIETGSDIADAQLVSGSIGGDLIYRDGRIRIAPMQVRFPRLAGQLGFDADLTAGSLRIEGPAALRGLVIDGVGTAKADTRIAFALSSGRPWTFEAGISGSLAGLPNATLRNLAGESVDFRTRLSVAAGAPVRFDELKITSPQIDLSGSGSWYDGRLALDGRGSHTRFGPFEVNAAVEGDVPSGELLLASPYPAAGLENVRLGFAPVGDSLRIETEGNSLLGEFVGVLGLTLPNRGPASLDVERLRVWQTSVGGRLVFEDGGVRGQLALNGGGLTGAIDLAPDRRGQGFSAELEADDAAFGGETIIELGQARITADGALGEASSRIRADLSGRAIRYGRLFLARVAAKTEIVDGKGSLAASMVGRSGGRFNLQFASDFAPGRIAAIARGNYAGAAITMPRRAVFTRNDDGSWRMAQSQFNLGQGRALVSGEFGQGRTRLELQLDRVPLSLGDLAVRDLGLGGSASGIVRYQGGQGLAPTGDARIKVNGLTRSGLLLASRPVDLALVADLASDNASARAVIELGGNRLGWIDGTIAGMPADGTLYERLQRGALRADLRYDGSAEALWRLAAIDALDLAGPVAIRARARGTLAEPTVLGTLASEDLRVRSVLSGTDITKASVSGDFVGSQLNLRRFAGSVSGGGTITGSGTIDLADIGPDRGPKIDLRASAKSARLVDARGLRATVTGPLRIISSGVGGTIAGRLEVDRASWQLGTAADDVSLPEIATREINLPADAEVARTPSAPWRYLIDARARSQIDVDGMGLDSEWRGNIILRGTTADPRIGGEAQVIRGTYSFASTRFDLTRGRISFDENVPIDPRLDIEAETRRDGLEVTVTVRGNALTPEIAFSSEPPLPEEEILSRLLFGGPITELSPTDALQLGAALASLRGGGGLDPINRLRSAIGLDRLRIVGADPALGRETGVALGKNITRRFYVELVTDGRGYSATELEFRITSWLSLLGSVSTLGRNSAVLEVSRDY